jgi:hypothetical protein
MKETINISVLGQQGAGKTSCLIAMLDHFKNDFFENLGLQFSIDPETGRSIAEVKSRLISSLEKGTVEYTDGITPTTAVANYSVRVSGKQKGLSRTLNLNFVDYPGSLLEASTTEASEIKQKLAESKVLIIPVDSALLMETDDDQSSETILKVFKDIYSDLNETRLVIFAPVKSEKYFEAGENNTSNIAYNLLIKRVQEKYEGVLAFLSSRAIKRKVSVIITPIQTLGSCKLMYFAENDDDTKTPVFVVTQRGVYAPKHSERPLIYLLSFLLRDQYEDQRKGISGFFGKLNGSLDNLMQYSEELSLIYSDYNGGVKIVQNSAITNF